MLQILYAWEIRGEGSLEEVARETVASRSVGARYRPYIDRLIRELVTHLPECEARLQETLSNWRIERLSVIDRNILRIGAVEILFCPDVPAGVAIHEAIRLAERYGSDESPRFVNGVLDAIRRGVPVADS